MKQREKTDKIFQDRMAKKTDELRWLYMELYGNDSMFFELCDQLHRFYEERSSTLKALDRKREADPGWPLLRQIPECFLSGRFSAFWNLECTWHSHGAVLPDVPGSYRHCGTWQGHMLCT